jgi:hypothetical protein
MIRPLVLALLAALPCATPGATPKNSISNELGFATGQSSPNNPRTGQLLDTLAGVVDLGAGWSADLLVGLTVVEPTKGVARKDFGSRGAKTLYFSPGVSWEVNERLAVSLAASYSPRSTLLTDTLLTYDTVNGRSVNADALLSSRTSSAGARASAFYLLGAGSRFETAIDGAIGVTRFDVEQRIAATRDASGAAVTDQQLLDFCETHRCSKQLLGLLRNQSTSLTQTEARLGVTETIGLDTDVGLGGSYFLYDRDPTDVGFYGLVADEHGPGFGGGIPLAPIRWSVRPEFAHRFGHLGVRVWLRHGRYIDDEGTTNVLGTKVQYRFTRSFRMWITASGQRDEDVQGTVTAYFQSALGAMWLF